MVESVRLGVDPEETTMDDADCEEGGDPVCWANLVCPDCGAITSEGHRAGCQLRGVAAPDDHHC